MKGDVVNLTFTAKPDYILAVRLAVSAIAQRLGYSIDDIEDIKVASAEACILLLSSDPDKIDICITIEDGLRMELTAQQPKKAQDTDDETNDLSQYLLESLVDTCDLTKHNGMLVGISIFKKL